jgi:hypothetical protein
MHVVLNWFEELKAKVPGGVAKQADRAHPPARGQS